MISTCKIYQGVTASAAAPIFFAPYKIDDTYFVDGALSANNPTELALNEGLRLWSDSKELDYILSLGTGIPPNENVSDNIFSWASSLAAKATDPNSIHQREKLHFKRIEATTKEKKYFRFNPPDISVELDSTHANSLDELITLTNNYLDQDHVQKKIKTLTNIIIAKSFYICSDIEFVNHPTSTISNTSLPSASVPSAEKIRVVLKIVNRVPTFKKLEKAFIFNHVPQNDSPPIKHTINKTVIGENGDEYHEISFISEIGTSYETNIQVILGLNEPPIHISGSPFTIVCIFHEF